MSKKPEYGNPTDFYSTIRIFLWELDKYIQEQRWRQAQLAINQFDRFCKHHKIEISINKDGLFLC